jgi:hypothetical protein
MVIRNYSPAEHYRFYTGSDKDFVGAPYDFSGVGLGSSSHWATLVSDNTFLSAVHYAPGVGENITFWDTNLTTGPKYTYKVTGGARIGTTDLWVGWFDSSVTVDDSIARYPVAMLSTGYDYLDLELYVYGKDQRVGRNVIDMLYMITVGSSTGLTAWYDYDNNDTPSVGGDEAYLQSGDSGGPSFTLVNSSLSLVGLHWAITGSPAYSIDTFVPEYYDEINTVLAGRGQSLSAISFSAPTPVPEPGLFWYSVIIAGFLWFKRQHKLF